MRAVESLDLSGRDVAAVLGLSEPTVSRMRSDEFRLEEGSRAFELGAMFIPLFRSLDAITGGDGKVAQTGCGMKTGHLAVVHLIRSR